MNLNHRIHLNHRMIIWFESVHVCVSDIYIWRSENPLLYLFCDNSQRNEGDSTLYIRVYVYVLCDLLYAITILYDYYEYEEIFYECICRTCFFFTWCLVEWHPIEYKYVTEITVKVKFIYTTDQLTKLNKWLYAFGQLIYPFCLCVRRICALQCVGKYTDSFKFHIYSETQI